MTVRLWLVRHGSTDWSDQGRFNGWTDVPLNGRGRAEAARLAGSLATRRFAGVWSSDLARAVETARLSVGAATPDRRLRELNFGAIEGRTWDECPPQIRRELLAFDSFAAAQGESVQDLMSRVAAFVEELPAGDHLLFTHGGVIRGLGRRLGRQIRVEPGEMVRLEVST